MNFRKLSSLVIIMLVVLSASIAQCPMCKMAAESNLENGGTAGLGLNMGILFMLTMPYLIVATLAFVWYRNRKREGDVLLDEANEILRTEGQMS